MKQTVITLNLILFLLFSSKSSAKPIYFTTSDGVQIYVNVVGTG